MKRLLLSLMLCAFALPVFAEQVTINVEGKLTEAQRAALAVKANQDAGGNNEITGPARVKEWVGIGTAIGSGLASSAHELGIAANDFAQTPVGKFTVFLIAWHFIGNNLLHIGFAVVWFTVLVPLWFYMYRRQYFRTIVTIYEAGKGPNGQKKVVTKEGINYSDESMRVCYWLTLFVIFGVGIITAFSG